MRGRARYVAVAVILVAGVTGIALADDFFSSSPGPLTSSHAAWDAQDKCNDCHVNDTKEVSNQKCLDCHDHNDLRARINAGKGFHASADVKGKKCESCHHEHKNRSYDLMGWSSVK